MLNNVFNYFQTSKKGGKYDSSIYIAKENGKIEPLTKIHLVTAESNAEDLIDDIRKGTIKENPYTNVYLIPEAIEYGIEKNIGPLVAIESEGDMLWIPASMLGEEYGTKIKNNVNDYRKTLDIQKASDYFQPYTGKGLSNGLPVFQLLGNDITRDVIDAYNGLSSHEETNAESANKLYF
jgi:hypothetical protein